MGVLTVRRVFTQQPQRPVRVDRSTNLGRKVIEHVAMRGEGATTVSQRPITYGSGGKILPGKNGLSLKGTGAGGKASFPLDLSQYSVITVAFWVNWDSYPWNDSYAMEFTPTAMTNAGGFYIDPDGPSALIATANANGSVTRGASFPQFSLQKYHRVAFTIDIRDQSFVMWLNGINIPRGGVTGTQQVGTKFANSTLYLLSRNNTSRLATANIQDVIFYEGALTADEIRQDFENPWGIFSSHRSALFTGNSLQPRGALYLDAQGRLAISPGGLNIRPLVLLNGQLTQRVAAEGAPVILVDGKLRTLASTETLVI